MTGGEFGNKEDDVGTTNSGCSRTVLLRCWLDAGNFVGRDAAGTKTLMIEKLLTVLLRQLLELLIRVTPAGRMGCSAMHILLSRGPAAPEAEDRASTTATRRGDAEGKAE